MPKIRGLIKVRSEDSSTPGYRVAQLMSQHEGISEGTHFQAKMKDGGGFRALAILMTYLDNHGYYCLDHDLDLNG